MKVSTEKLDKTKAQITVEIPEEEFENSLQKAYRIVIKKVNIPGFRKGKAPRRILENIYGREILIEDALQDAIPTAYLKALEEIKDDYKPVSEPEYDLVQAEKGSPVIFKAKFDLKPEVKLGQYKDIELEKISVEITDEDVEKELVQMQQRYAKLIVVDGPAIIGDVLSIDFLGKVDGQPFEGGAGENYTLELGSNTFIPGFEEQLTGTNVHETKDVAVTFPEDYHAENLKGKDAVFTVTVKEIKRKELADLDDEFAKDVSEFANMQELRQDIKNKLNKAAQENADSELKSNAIKRVAENAELDIPASMIEKRIDRLIQDFEYRLQQQGIIFDYYLQATNTKIEDLRNSYRAGAEASVRGDLVLEEIARVEQITVTPEDIDKEIDKMAETYKQEPTKLREFMEKQGQISALEFGIMIDKAIDLIIAEAKTV